MSAAPRRRPQHRHHRPRRPRQDHAGRRHAAPDGRLPRQRAGRRAGDGLVRARARARHHDPREEHHRHAGRASSINIVDTPGPRRLRRRGRAHARHGRRRPAPGRRLRGPAAADALRPRQGARGGPRAGRLPQQDRPRRRAPRRGARRDLRPLHRPRRQRGSSSTSRSSTRTRAPGTATRDLAAPGADLRPLFETIVAHAPRAAARARRAHAVPGQQPRLRRLRRPARHRPRRRRRAASPAASTRSAAPTARRCPCKLTRALRLAGPASASRSSARVAGDIVAVAGIEDIAIGDTIADRERPDAAAAHPRRRADHRDALRRQHEPVGGTRRQPGDVAAAPRAPRSARAQRNVSLRVEETRRRPTPSASSAAASCSSRS